MAKFLMAALCLLLVGSMAAAQAPVAACSGRVADANGNAVEGAEVVALARGMSPVGTGFDLRIIDQATTGADGEFVLRGPIDRTRLEQIAYVVARKEALAVDWDQWKLADPDVSIALTLRPPATISGLVTDAAGAPINGAEVRAVLVKGEGDAAKSVVGIPPLDWLATRTDAKGRFTFVNVPAESRADFVVTAAGCAPVATRDEKDWFRVLHYKPGQNDIVVKLPKESVIEGKTVKKDDGPLAGIPLLARLTNGDVTLSPVACVSDERGRYRAAGLGEGSYVIALAPPRGRAADWVADPIMVDTEAGRRTTADPIELEKGGLLEVTVTDAETHGPIEMALVSATPRYGMAQRNLMIPTSRQGVAVLRLAAGKYLVNVSQTTRHLGKSGDTSVDVADGGTVRSAIALTPRPSIHGFVRESDGKPAVGIEVISYPSSGYEGVSGVDGGFRMPLAGRDATGPFTIVARDLLRNQCAVVSLPDAKQSAELTLSPARIIAGRVTAEDGKALPGLSVRIELVAPTGGQVGFVTPSATNGDGSFEIKAVPESTKYTVRVSATGFGNQSVTIDAAGVKMDKYEAPLIVLSAADQTISGIVVDADDKPVAKANVAALAREGDARTEATTDDAGRFVLKNLSKGEFRIWAGTETTSSKVLATVQAGAADVKIVVWPNSDVSYNDAGRLSLVGSPLPDLATLGVKVGPDDLKDKRILVCFLDVSQRPSRHLASALVEKSDALAKQGVLVIAVQAAPVDEAVLKDFSENTKLTVPLAILKTDDQKTRSAWAVQALPWLILADAERVVRAEGFGLEDLDGRLKDLSQVGPAQ